MKQNCNPKPPRQQSSAFRWTPFTPPRQQWSAFGWPPLPPLSGIVSICSTPSPPPAADVICEQPTEAVFFVILGFTLGPWQVYTTRLTVAPVQSAPPPPQSFHLPSPSPHLGCTHPQPPNCEEGFTVFALNWWTLAYWRKFRFVHQKVLKRHLHNCSEYYSNLRLFLQVSILLLLCVNCSLQKLL